MQQTRTALNMMALITSGCGFYQVHMHGAMSRERIEARLKGETLSEANGCGARPSPPRELQLSPHNREHPQADVLIWGGARGLGAGGGRRETRRVPSWLRQQEHWGPRGGASSALVVSSASLHELAAAASAAVRPTAPSFAALSFPLPCPLPLCLVTALSFTARSGFGAAGGGRRRGGRGHGGGGRAGGCQRAAGLGVARPTEDGRPACGSRGRAGPGARAGGGLRGHAGDKALANRLRASTALSSLRQQSPFFAPRRSAQGKGLAATAESRSDLSQQQLRRRRDIPQLERQDQYGAPLARECVYTHTHRRDAPPSPSREGWEGPSAALVASLSSVPPAGPFR